MSPPPHVVQTDMATNRALNKKLVLYLWDVIISTALATNVILFGVGVGAQVITDLCSERRKPDTFNPPAILTPLRFD